MTLDELLQKAIDTEASDLHLYAGYPPMLRVAGKLEAVDAPPLTDQQTDELIELLVADDTRAVWREDPMPVINLTLQGPGGSVFRTTIHRSGGRPGAALRYLPSQVPSAQQLGLPDVLQRAVDARQGFVVVTGPVGSGKTTTMYSLVDAINGKRAAHIVTLSDPMEFVLQPKRSIVRQIEIGTDIRSFQEAARTLLRMDPDVVVVGEMRDLETVRLTITLAETGHLVFAPIHCASVAEACSRLVDVFPPTQQQMVGKMLSLNLFCVIAQRLLPRADGKGRVAAQEIMFMTSEMRQLVQEQRFGEITACIAQSRNAGMQTMRQHIQELHRQAIITGETAKTFSALAGYD